MWGLLATFLIILGLILLTYGLERAHERWIRPRTTRRWLDKALARIGSSDYTPPAKQSDLIVSFDAFGIALSKARPAVVRVQSIGWSDMVRVVAFKRDLWTVDCICLAIQATDGTIMEVNEEMEGWEALTDTIPKHLPGSKEWAEIFWQVAFPAFATNEMVIFERTPSAEYLECDRE
jgi:hypothetical protein